MSSYASIDFEIAGLRRAVMKGDTVTAGEPLGSEDEAALLAVADSRGYQTIKGLDPSFAPYNTLVSVGDSIDEPQYCLARVIFKDAQSPQEAQRERASKYGIAVKDNTNVTMPGQFEDAGCTESDFADPVNFKLPCYDPPHTRNAASRWEQIKSGYSPREQSVIERRLEAKKKKHDVAQDDSGDKPDVQKDRRPFALWERENT